jgi:cytochrome c oxidase cbb3-type subunit 1
MTNVSSNARPAPAERVLSAEVTPIDTHARGPLLFLIGSAALWLVLGSVLALIAAIQLHSPGFLGNCEWFTYGRTVALQETAFVYGWAANAGIAVALWLLARLGGEALRASNWLFLGAAFWNLGVTVGEVGIATGDMTSFSLLELPRYVQPLLLFSWGTMAVAGVLAWSGRRREGTYASQWYAVAALFLFPWLFSAAQVVLLWAPVRGVVQAIAAGWYAQSVWTLWLAPLALAAAYYVIPKVSGRVLPSYEFASLGFWSLIFIGPWTGGRHLIGGPVPAWIATMAIVSCALLLFHYLIVALNLRAAYGSSGTATKFVTFGLTAYLLSGVLDAITAFRHVAVETQFTLIPTAQQVLAFYGAATMMFFGAIYFMVPRITGRPWASSAFATGHRLLLKAGVLITVLALAVGGWTQGTDLLNAKVSFGDIFAHLNLCLLAVMVGQVVLLIANLLFLVNFLRSACACVTESAAAVNPFRPATTTMEAHAS